MQHPLDLRWCVPALCPTHSRVMQSACPCCSSTQPHASHASTRPLACMVMGPTWEVQPMTLLTGVLSASGKAGSDLAYSTRTLAFSLGSEMLLNLDTSLLTPSGAADALDGPATCSDNIEHSIEPSSALGKRHVPRASHARDLPPGEVAGFCCVLAHLGCLSQHDVALMLADVP